MNRFCCPLILKKRPRPLSPHQLTETATWNLCMASAHGVSTCDVNPLSLGQRTESQNLVGPRCSLIHRLCCLGPDPGCPRGSHAHPSPGPSPTLPDQGLMQAVQAEAGRGLEGGSAAELRPGAFLPPSKERALAREAGKGVRELAMRVRALHTKSCQGSAWLRDSCLNGSLCRRAESLPHPISSTPRELKPAAEWDPRPLMSHWIPSFLTWIEEGV